jgi:membrane-bound serine protease (ClpP class)
MDPTLIYLLLLVGLWVGATSFLISGTGLAEFSAVGLLGIAFFGLVGLSAQWWSVMLLAVSVSAFILIPLALPRFSRWAELALVPQVVASLFLFEGTAAHPVAILASTGMAFAYNRFLLLPLLGQLREAPAVGNEGEELLGAVGRVTSAAAPGGAAAAYINGETWTVRAAGALEPGDTVRVVDVHGLAATVERVKAKRVPLDDSMADAEII